LLNLSYGYGKVFIVPHEFVDGQVQGGMCQLPLAPFPTGIIRGRFHPQDGQLYVCGLYSWAGSVTQPGGLYRIRYTGRQVHLPIGLHAFRHGVEISFSGALREEAACRPEHYAVKVWSLKRSAQYGSQHYNERTLAVAAADVAADGKTVRLHIPELEPTWCMEIAYELTGAEGEAVSGVIHNTIHRLAEER
jgi:hypothetical protein